MGVVWYTSRVVFVHVPRTGGDWLTAWAAEHLPLLGRDADCLKHAGWPALLLALPGLAGRQPFAVQRDDRARRASYFRHALAWRPSGPNHPDGWAAIAAAAHALGEAAWVERYAAPNDHYLTDGVLTFPYEPDLTQCVSWLRQVHQVP